MQVTTDTQAVPITTGKVSSQINDTHDVITMETPTVQSTTREVQYQIKSVSTAIKSVNKVRQPVVGPGRCQLGGYSPLV